ncbi:PREDICTED: protein high chlorophyll fluorescent 107 [Nicotiana attenuata]|uniref:Protein high chlorophyll fluorescent 107 n=1 Tax=Nicotiana attenuata TaxID=49451 RepID=A0A314KUD9_NICAT|nr:PREDICTED: protein high chlorophyll fluorescent 107 [Nicotiana attenuata]OIT32882.1 protein high chlorophyll fluorescent 107 [Nicotiana attenuata]
MGQFSFTSPSSSNFTLFYHTQNHNPSKFHFSVPFRTSQPSSSHPLLPPFCSHESSSSSPLLEENPETSRSSSKFDRQDRPYNDEVADEISTTKKSMEELLVVRRPVKDPNGEVGDEKGEEMRNFENSQERNDLLEEQSSSSSFPLDDGLRKFAKKMPIFEPNRLESGSGVKPLKVNLDLALYRAKILARKYQYADAEKILQQCIDVWPEDGRPYVALGKILSKQSKLNEARAVYEKGCQATQGENPYIWQCWAILENRMGNIRRARELFDAATVADKKHIAAWHGWAVLELKQGNIKKARNLLGKGLKFCGGNEYVYQTLALLEAKAKRYERARYLFKQATKCNRKSCASWLAWAQLEAQLENNRAARQLFERAVQASPKNRFAWHVWGVFEANLENIDQGRKLLTIGHMVNPRDPVLLQSLALIEYKHSSANLARVLFRRASEMDPRHQPVWIAWGWMEWKEGNISTARELYQRALSINSTTESAARCLQAWGVLEQRAGNLSAARRLFRSSLNINSQSYITWMTWANLEEDQGNSVRAEEIRNLYFQQRTEVVDDESWIMGFLDVIDPAIDSIKRLLNLDQNSYYKVKESSNTTAVDDTDGNTEESTGSSSTNISQEESTGSSSANISTEESAGSSSSSANISTEESGGSSSGNIKDNSIDTGSGFDLDDFIREMLSLDPSKLEVQLTTSLKDPPKTIRTASGVWRPTRKTTRTS